MRQAMRNLVSPKLALLTGVVLAFGGGVADAQHFQQTNLVSDQPGMAAMTDANLVNAWGLTRSSTSPWWVANNGTGTSTLYDGAGVARSLVVTIPSAMTGATGVPTGTVFNGTTDFALTPGNPARFLFVTEDGTISGWNPAVDATHAVVKASDPGAVYKGAAIATVGGAHFLYVADFARRRIDVFDTSFHKVSADDGHERGDDDHHSFRDERLPRGFGPFNVQNIGGDLYVSFAKLDSAMHDEVPGPGMGYVDVFSSSGHLLRRLEHGPWLNAPWGLALAPADFGAFSHNVLVGQFGSGQIAAFDAVSGAFLGMARDTSDAVLTIDGLWALAFGNDATAGQATTLYFTAGPNDEAHGLFGMLKPVAAEQLLGSGQ
jgi:uncharacterized protein (TIGR03118 family)